MHPRKTVKTLLVTLLLSGIMPGHANTLEIVTRTGRRLEKPIAKLPDSIFVSRKALTSLDGVSAEGGVGCSSCDDSGSIGLTLLA